MLTSSALIPAWNAPVIGAEVVLLPPHPLAGHQGIVVELDAEWMAATVWILQYQRRGYPVEVRLEDLGLIEQAQEWS